MELYKYNDHTVLRKRVAKRFSLSATSYDTEQDIQHIVARRLNDLIACYKTKLIDIHNAIDIGCGTGIMSDKVHSLFPFLTITGVDIAPKMAMLFNKKFEDSKNVASVTYGLSGYKTNYDPRILVLQLTRG